MWVGMSDNAFITGYDPSIQVLFGELIPPKANHTRLDSTRAERNKHQAQDNAPGVWWVSGSPADRGDGDNRLPDGVNDGEVHNCFEPIMWSK